MNNSLTAPAALPLTSYRLVQSASPIECGLCGEPNGKNAERCRHCGAPLVLSQQLANPKNAPRILAVIGPPESGKTCWIGLWSDIMARRSGHDVYNTYGAFSVAIQHHVVGCLSRGWFPPATEEDPTTWFWLHGSTHHRKRRLQFVVPDIAGRAVTAAVEASGSQPLVAGLLQLCSAILLTLDGERLAAGDRAPDFWALKALHYLADLSGPQPPAVAKPLALVLTKVDRCEPARDFPDLWLPRLAPATFEYCRRRWKEWGMFCISVAAGAGFQRFGAHVRSFPTRVEPFGLEQPFRWVLDRLR
ncbi:MAG: hypothetical protein KatS3mg110_4452 [Pirellulaceae bacterium]|nr:MAG: hypothetical protein KatS3mg110_4452 [Pirellulaceae bacterium]